MAAGMAGPPNAFVELNFSTRPDDPKIIATEIAFRMNTNSSSNTNRCVRVAPEKSFSPGDVIIMFGEDPFGLLDSYASGAGRSSGAKISRPLCGWGSWHYYMGAISEDKFLATIMTEVDSLSKKGTEQR